MAATADHLVHVLEQYKERLHKLGDEGHDEELNYIKQILASPIFHDYIRDSSQLSQEQTSIFSEVTNDLLSGIQDSPDGPVSPTEKHKQRLQRKQSLKALRNVVTPKNSPRIKTKRSHDPNSGEIKYNKHEGASMSAPPDRGPGFGAASGGRFQNVTSPVAMTANGKRSQDTPLSSRTSEHGYAPMTLSNGGLEFDTSSATGTPLVDSQARNLTNSTSTLIERSTSPSSDGTLNTRSSENLIANGGTPSSGGGGGSGSALRHSLKTDSTLATSSAYALGNGTGPGSILGIGLDWDHHPPTAKQLLSSSIHDPGPPQGLKLKFPPVAHRQPPSYQLHMQSQQQQQHQQAHVQSGQTHNPPPHHRIVTSPQVEMQRPPPPPYGQQTSTTSATAASGNSSSTGGLQSTRRAKSFDRLLDSDSSVPIHLPPLKNVQQPSPQDMKKIAHQSPFGVPVASPSQYGNPIVRPMTDGVATKNLPTMADRRRTTLTVRLEKGEKGLGFRVKGLKNEQFGGLFVQDLQSGGVAERDGQLRVDDQITHINGHALKDLPHNEGVKLLQSTRGIVELVIMRDISHAYPPPPAPPLTSTSSLHHKLSPDPSSVGRSTSHPLNFTDKTENGREEREGGDERGDSNDDSTTHQRKIQSIELPNEGQGFGFGVINTENGLTIVHSIVQGGIAEKDGRLQQGDQLLQINEESVIHMRYDDVIAKLRSVSTAGQPVKLVIARKVQEDQQGDVEISDVHSSDDEIEEFEVEILKKSGGGLGITIAGLVKTDTGEEVMGIYVTSMNPVGAAASDGRIQVGDRILKVDGHSLRGLENMEAASVLRKCGNPVKLVLCRKRSAQENEVSEEQAPDIDNAALKSPELMRSERDGKAEVGRGDLENGESELEEVTIVEELVEEWSNKLGPKYEVKVDQVRKSDEVGLGIRMESTTELDDQGQPHMDSLHHVIHYINPAGPIGQHNILREGDEIIMVNGRVLVGLPHDEATKVILNTPKFVTIVVCRTVNGEGLESETTESHRTESETTTEGVHSEEDRRPMLTPDTLQALPAIDFSNLGDFARRFERQSWRERHEEERRRLKERFEQRRKEHERHIRQQEEELLQKEMEFKERQRRQTEEEEKRKRAEAEQKSLSENLQYDYGLSYPGYPEYERQVQSPDSMQESDSSASVLSPVPGSTIWEVEINEIDLIKGEEGLGFSILDFADPHNPGDRVILIHSLVDGGTAERDGRLKVGDKLLSVNRVSVVNHSLQFAVQQLVAVPLGGLAKIGVCHPLPVTPDINSDPSSPLTESHESINFEDEQEEEDEEDDGSIDNAASLELEDEDKPVLDLALPDQDQETCVHDSAEEGEDVKKKKPSETDDDDEPPPPYSKNDPVEDDKSDNEGGDPSAQQNAVASNSSGGGGGIDQASNEGETRGEGEAPNEGMEVVNSLADHRRLEAPTESFGFEVQEHHRGGANERSQSSENILTSENDTDASRPSSQAQRSPASMSRISSPERGRTLSELTRITPEDESRIGGGQGTASTSSFPVPANDDQLESVYSSDTTLVNSESQPSQTEVSHESSVSSIVADASSTPRVHHKKEEKKSRRIKIRGRKNDKTKSSSSSEHKLKISKKEQNSFGDKRRRHQLQSPLQRDPPSHHNLMVNYSSLSQQAFTSSQDSNFDIGLSPEGESGEHSSEIDTEPREIRIQKEAASNLGLILTYDDKSNAIVVKSVSSSGPVAKDGRIRVGDRIDSINGKSMIGVNTNKARQIVKKTAKMDEVLIVYVPAVQTYIPTSSTLNYGNNRDMSLNDSQGSLLSTGSGSGGQPTYQQQITLVSQQDNLLTSQAGAMTHHPAPRMHMGPQITSAEMPRHVHPTPPQWPPMEPFHPGSMAPPPPRHLNMQQRGYYDDQMGKPPPPPYGYVHQSTTPPQGILPNQPSYAPSITTQPTPPMPWNIHQTAQATPGNFGMGVSMMQPPPGMIAPHPPHWGIPPRPPPPTHPQVMAPRRDPPQYSDFHAMAAATQQIQASGVQQNQIVQGRSTYQNLISTSSGAHMSPVHGSGGGGGGGVGPGGMTGSGSGHLSLQNQQQSQLPPRPTMNKSQSETKFQGGGAQRTHHERRHNSQGTSDTGQQFQVSYQQGRPVQVRRHSSKQKQPSGQRQHPIEDIYDNQQKLWLSQDTAVVHRNSSGGEGFANRKAHSQPNISHGGGGGGIDRERPDRTRPSKHPRAATLQESPDHSHHNSWAINDEEDPALREEFPEVDGHLFEVRLKKGKSGGLGLSIAANTGGQADRGIVIMGMKKGGAAEENGEIKWGDMILKVNDTCVIGMTQTQVQELLAKSPSTVRIVLQRQYSNGAGGGGGGANNGRSGGKQQHTTTGSGISLEGLPQLQALDLYCRDKKKGFGFTIERCDEGSGAYTVIVSSIARGGVADLSGQLKVGDQIVSVDGTKTLGYGVEKARNLIQQGKARGHVALVVATRGHASSLSQSEWSGEKLSSNGASDSRSKMKEIPDGVVLRKKKKSSLKSSSRRRPVSVDYELNSNSWENGIEDPADDKFPMGGAAVGGALKEATNRSSHYSNRNSHPLTEREMEQGLQNLEGQKDIVPLKECELIIFKGHQVLGLIITGGTDSLLNGIYIQKIIPGSPADKDGRLKPGDKILKINNSSMECVARDEALHALQHSSSFVHITIVRDPNNAPTMPAYKEEESPSPISSGGEIETVELIKPEVGGLGLLIFEPEDKPGVFIQEVVQNKAAYLDGRICSGDKILAINGEKIYNAGQNYVVRLLQTCRGRVTLTVCHPLSAYSSPSRDFLRSSDLEGAHPAFPPPDYPYDREPLSYSTSGGAQSNSRHPFQNQHKHKGSGSGFSGGPPMTYQYGYGADPDIDMPMHSQDEGEERNKVKVICLHRGSLGLGFSIVGGKGSVHGDLPIYIKHVYNEGAAGLDGRLKKGDQLLAVNGVSFENVTHKFAADTLKYLQDVKLEVISNFND